MLVDADVELELLDKALVDLLASEVVLACVVELVALEKLKQ